MKTKLLLIVMSVVLFVNSYDLRVFASTDYDHNELLDYPGYGEAMYETVVEQTTFISGRYTENKEYVSNTIEQIGSYARNWWNEYETISNMPPKEKLREMINAAGGYALTVGDFIKNLFTDYGNDNEGLNAIDTDDLTYFSESGTTIYLKTGYRIAFSPPNSSTTYYITQAGTSAKNNATASYVEKYFAGTFNGYIKKYISDSTKLKNEALAQSACNITGVGSLMSCMNWYGASTHLEYMGVPANTGSSNPIYRNLYDNISDSSNPPTMVIPQPKAYLSCPDGTRINMSINGGTFLDVGGKVMQVSKDGTATVDSQLCNLGWEKPKVQYVDGTERVGITTPEGDIIDAETGEIITPGEIDEEITDDCGMICAIGKFMSGLGTIAKAIAALPLKLLDGLLELIKEILIPEENFWTSNMDDLKSKFFHDEVKEVQDGIQGLTSAGGGQFGDVTGSLLGVDNLKIIDSSSINMSLDTLHSWVRGFFYPLLLFYNINQMYRVIRGTSLVGMGGKKDE